MPKYEVPYWSIPILMLIFVSQGCNRFDLDDYIFDEPDQKEEHELEQYADSLRVWEMIENLPNDKQRIDTLIFYAEWLKNYDEDISLEYAQAAYDIATNRNWNIPRIASAFRLAWLKGRMGEFGEGIEDAKVDANICKRLLEDYNNPYWDFDIDNLFGYLFIKTGHIDSSRKYYYRAYDKITKLKLDEQFLSWNKAFILHSLATTYQTEDSTKSIALYQKSDSIYQKISNQENRAQLWRDLGNFFQEWDNFEQADSLFALAIEYGNNSKDSKILADTYRARALMNKLLFTEYKDHNFFRQAREDLRESQKNTTENQYRIYELLGNIYQDYWVFEFYEDTTLAKSLADSSILYYKKSMLEAQKEGAISTLKIISKNLVTSLCKYSGDACKRGFGSDVSLFLDNIYTGATETVIDQSRKAFQRTNRVVIRDIETQANIKRRNIMLGGLAVLFLVAVIFVFILQRQQNKRLKAQMEALRAQINPHFMSNSLNAIESLVNLGKTREASKYLVHFSRLTRQILTSSRTSIISLKEELATLKHFLALEQLRFRDKLTYDIHIDSEVRPELAIIPSMTLQPYIENAIWHGLKPKPEGGHIKVYIEREGKVLRCTVEDNGIGREEARQMRETSVVKHKSAGMKITEERLKAMGRVKGLHVEVKDLKANTGEAIGTKVIIRLPYKSRKQ